MFVPLQGTGQHPETFLVVTSWEMLLASSGQRLKNIAKGPLMPRTAPTRHRITGPEMSTVLRLSDPDLVEPEELT